MEEKQLSRTEVLRIIREHANEQERYDSFCADMSDSYSTTCNEQFWIAKGIVKRLAKEENV